jgi:predicted ATPase with chaperone activity
MAGGEMTLADLELRFSPTSKFYVAPLQLKANGGVLVIDDFGRQRMRPDELLNRWMIPMDRSVDHLTFHTGETIQVPFDSLLIFSTNLTPSKLGDEAFFRRIRHKVRISDPTPENFRRILRAAAERLEVPYSMAGEDYLVTRYYGDGARPMRGVHPRDILNHIRDLARFRRQHPSLTPEWIDAACASYFVND